MRATAKHNPDPVIQEFDEGITTVQTHDGWTASFTDINGNHIQSDLWTTELGAVIDINQDYWRDVELRQSVNASRKAIAELEAGEYGLIDGLLWLAENTQDYRGLTAAVNALRCVYQMMPLTTE